jgi:putative flippase GtrA
MEQVKASSLADRLMLAVPAQYRQVLGEFLRFGTVGAIGFCFDAGTVYALSGSIGLYGAGIAAYFVASSVNWVFNRLWTFRHRAHGAAHVQWARFVAVNLIGFVLNRGAYVALIAETSLARHYPILAVAAGSFAGFGINFLLSRRIVFR